MSCGCSFAEIWAQQDDRGVDVDCTTRVLTSTPRDGVCDTILDYFVDILMVSDITGVSGMFQVSLLPSLDLQFVCVTVCRVRRRSVSKCVTVSETGVVVWHSLLEMCRWWSCEL